MEDLSLSVTALVSREKFQSVARLNVHHETDLKPIEANFRLEKHRSLKVKLTHLSFLVLVSSNRNNEDVFDDNYFLPSRQLYVEAIGACGKGLSVCSSCRFAQK